MTFAAETATLESSTNEPRTKESRRNSTFLREGAPTQSVDLDLYGTLQSFPQTSIVTEEENREIERNQSRNTSMGNLFNQTKMSKQTLPPIEVMSPSRLQ